MKPSHSDPSNSINIFEQIHEVYQSLSAAQTRIADFILQKPEEAIFLSLKKLALEIGVAPITILHFSKRLGFSGYSELKTNLQDFIKSFSSPRRVVRDNWPDQFNESIDEVLNSIINNELDLIHTTYHMIDRESLLASVEHIIKGRRIFLAASGVVTPIIETFAMRLHYLQKEVYCIDCSNIPLLPSIFEKVNSQDVFVIFSFPHYMMLLREIGRCAKKKGATVIGITDKATSPITAYSDLRLFCESNSLYFNISTTSALSLVNTIVAVLLTKTSPQIEDTSIQKILEPFYPPMTNL